MGLDYGKKVVVSNGCHRFHLYQTALAYQQAGMLQHLIAGWYIKNPAVDRILKTAAVSRALGSNFARRVRARRQEGLDPARVISLIIPDVVERLGRSRIAKLGPAGWFSYLSMLTFGWLSQRYVEGVEVFHVRSGYGRFAMERAKRTGARCLVDHSIADPIFIAETLKSEAARWGLAYEFSDWHWQCVSRDLDEADHILANSDFVRDTLGSCRGISPDRITVLPWGVDLERFSPAPGEKSTSNPFRILFVGELGLRKGVLYLLEAFKKLQLPQAELVLVGGVSEIGSLMAPMGVQFRQVPVMPQEDLLAFYRHSSLFVFPSLVEGSARVVQEAMACGLPVITTLESGSVVRDGVEGFIVPIRDVEALCQRISELYKDPDKRQEMGLAARATAENRFAPQKYCQGIINLSHTLSQKN